MAVGEAAVAEGAGGHFPRYLASSTSWGMALSIQSTVFAWLVATELMATPGQLGVAQAIVLIPGVIALLIGGVAGDYFEPRKLITRVYLLALIGPAILALAFLTDRIGPLSLLSYALAWSLLNGYVTPARDALLSKVSRQHIQRTITILGAAAGATGILGFFAAGQLDQWGILPVVSLQAGLMILAAIAIRTLPTFPPMKLPEGEKLTVLITLRKLRSGFRDAWAIPPIRAATVINIVTGLINVGVFLAVLPIVARDVYGGTALNYAFMLMAFMSGSFLASISVFPLMPFRYPGRWLLLTLIIPATVCSVVAFEPPFWAVLVLFGIWGANAAIWSAMARAIVQDAAPEEMRARIMAIYNFGLSGTAPIGALIAGAVAGWIGPSLALLMVPATSLPLMIWGFLATRLWHHTHEI